MNHNKKKTIYRVAALGLAILTLASNTVSAYADYRDAGKWSITGGIATSNKSSYTYYQQQEGGMSVVVPYSPLRDVGQDVIKKMFTGLFDIYKSGVGSHYSSAGFKYNTSLTAGGNPGRGKPGTDGIPLDRPRRRRQPPGG